MNKTIHRALIFLCILTAGLMLIRCFFGIEKTDEAFYVANAVNALQGNYPYAYNFGSSAGAAIPVVPLVALYQLFVPDLEGIFLFMRISFTLFKLFLLFIIYFLLKDSYKKWAVLLVVLFMIPYCGATIGTWSYNTIPTCFSFFIGILLGSALDKGDVRRLYISAAISGVVACLAELAHPLSFMSVIFYGVMILLFSPKGRRIIATTLYTAGGVLATAIIMGIIALKAGIGHLAYGLNILLFGRGGYTGRTTQVKLRLIYRAYGHMWVLMFAAAAGIILLYAVYRKRKKQKYIWKQAIQLATIGALLIGMIYLVKMTADLEVTYLGAAMVIMLVNLFFSKKRLPFLIAIPPVLFCFTEIWLTSNSEPTGRFIFLVPIFVAAFLMCSDSNVKTVRYLSVVVCLLGTLIMVKASYQYVYRDVSIRQMNYRMPSGIFKGLYTEEQNGKDMLELEAYIHEITEPGEWIKFCDNVPVGYLFQDGSMCDIQAWDSMNYTYGKNNPRRVYNYFINREAIPDKIIYVDFKRDPQLSIEDDTWLFNEFVNEFYTFEEERQLNSTYRIKVYLRAKDYTEYLEWVQDYL